MLLCFALNARHGYAWHIARSRGIICRKPQHPQDLMNIQERPAGVGRSEMFSWPLFQVNGHGCPTVWRVYIEM